MSTNSLYNLVSVYLPDGTWAGQFMDEATAKSWLKAQGINHADCEISTRKVDRKTRKAAEAASS